MYLIQRMTVRPKVNVLDKNLRFGEVFALDYMGAAEFEFGAFSRFMRAFYAAPRGAAAYQGSRRATVIYDVTLNDIQATMKLLDSGRARLKERAEFREEGDTNAWACIDKNCMFVAICGRTVLGEPDKEVRCLDMVSAFLANSITYMDRQAES